MSPPRGASALAAAVLALIAGCSSGSSPAPSPAPSTPTPTPTDPPIATPTASPIATPLIIGDGWQPAAEQDAIASLGAVTWTGATFVAAGTSRQGEFAIAESTDGQTWRSMSIGRDTASGMELAAGPNGVVVVGTIGDRSFSWYSRDALHWTEPATFPLPRNDDVSVRTTDVVATPNGWLAVGRADPGTGSAVNLRPIRALIWTSTDGLRWSLVEPQPSLAKAGINAVAAVDGGFVAVGTRGTRAAIWTSADGTTWTEAPDDPMFWPPADVDEAWVTASGVAAARGSTVVVGTAYGVGAGGAPLARAWWSTDEGSWLEAVVELPEVGQPSDVAATSERFLATGPSWPDMSSCLGGIWASTDGAIWRCEATELPFSGFVALEAAGSPTVEIVIGGMRADGTGTLPGDTYAIWRPVARSASS
jgi:hypothetical protein